MVCACSLSREVTVVFCGSVSFSSQKKACGSLLRSRKALPGQPSATRARGVRGARVHRTHASAAALHARRITPKKRRRRKTACSSWLVRWPRCCAGGPARRCGPRTWFMRDRNSDAAPPSVPNYPSQPTAAPPAPASSPTPVLVIAARESLDASMLPGSRGWKRTPSPAPLPPPPHP